MLLMYCIVMVMTLAMTGVALLYARRRQLVDEPGERRSHSVATARGGGIAIVVMTLLGCMALLGIGLKQPTFIGFVVGFTAVAIIGWIDDHRPLSVKIRLGIHVLAALAFALSVLAELGVSAGGMTFALLAFTLCLVLTNVWNFMDGINGIAAGTGVVVFLAYSMLSFYFWQGITLVLSAACLGFLFWNFPKAKIFMGDVSSGAIGFAGGSALIMAAVWLMTNMKDGAVYASPLPVIVLVLLLSAPLAPFLVDTSLTLARRILNKEPWWTAHAQHAYQVLARRFGHPRVTLGYVVLSAVGVGLVAYFYRSSMIVVLFSGMVWYICNVIFWLFVQRKLAK